MSEEGVFMCVLNNQNSFIFLPKIKNGGGGGLMALLLLQQYYCPRPLLVIVMKNIRKNTQSNLSLLSTVVS